jgi:ectoine hydroxylase-related dioxygenase (phytanoyl-CoA dioxygenase family)
MALTQVQREQYERDGYILVSDLFDSEPMRAALAEMERIFYGKSYAEYLADFDRNPSPVKDGFHGDTGEGRSQFPTGSEALDRLIENEEYLDIFAQCLGTPQVSYCNAHLFMRSGPTDKRHAEHPWQGYHFDRDTNSFLPPSAEAGRFEYVNSDGYLHDVEDDGAPMHVIPGSHRQITAILPRLIREGSFTGRNAIKDIREVPEFATPVPTTARAGSALFYSSDLVHAAVPFRNKRKQRAFWTLSLARAENQAWTKLANPWNYPERGFTTPFWTTTTPRVRTLFGWPPPGHPYYTQQTLELLETWFPGMDLSAYRVRVDGR